MFVVNSQPVGCHQDPSGDALIVVQRDIGTIQTMNQLIKLPDGTWHHEVNQGCWTRTDPGPVRIFSAQADAEKYAFSVLPVAAKKQRAQLLDPRLLVSDPKARVGQNIILQGKALNVDQYDDYTWVNLQAVVPGRSTTEAIVVEMRPKTPQLLSDECYRFFGVVEGTTEVQRKLTGAVNEVPLVYGYLYETAPRGRFDIGCASP
jgi:hypothetical protein